MRCERGRERQRYIYIEREGVEVAHYNIDRRHDVSSLFSYLLVVEVSCDGVVSDIVVAGPIPGLVVASLVDDSVDSETL